MLSGGDELGHTQGGNNNAYCQDNRISWYPWDDVDEEFVAWCRRVIAFRSAHPVFRRRQWFRGRLIRGIEDLAWVRPDGGEMTDEDWERGYARAVGVFLNGRTIPTPNAYGERIVDDSFLVLFNASDQDLPWHIPGVAWGRRWVVDLDTADPRRGLGRTIVVRPNDDFSVTSRSLVVLRSTRPPPRHPTLNQRGHSEADRADDASSAEVAAAAATRPAAADTGRRPDAAPAQPDATQPDTAQPDTAQPDTAQPDTAQPDTAQPDTAQPDTAQPDTAQPDTAQPEAAQPGARRTDRGQTAPDERDELRPLGPTLRCGCPVRRTPPIDQTWE